MDDAKWLPPCGIADEIRKQYDKLMVTMEDSIKHLYRKWRDSLEEDMQNRLDRPLLARSHSNPGLMESNFDRLVSHTCYYACVIILLV